MDWLIILVIVLGFFLLWLFLKNFFPSYMDEKGKNLATKEDIEEITRKTEEVQQEFKEKIELFSSDVRFKYDYYYKQYSELYSNLYSFVVQSEYVRKFIELTTNEFHTFVDVQFFEITPIHRVTITFKPEKYERKVEDIDTAVSSLNKDALCEYIISKGDLATQKLLKIAVAYRFVSARVDDTDQTVKRVAQEQELKMLAEMVRCIVSDYNKLRANLHLCCDEEEMTSGRISLS